MNFQKTRPFKVSKPKARQIQKVLWDDLRDLPFSGEKESREGTVRTLVGKFVENIGSIVLGAQLCPDNSTCHYCPDLYLNGRYIECKSIGNSNQLFVYEGRLLKDRRFVLKGNILYYFIWQHQFKTKYAESHGEVVQGLIKYCRRVYVVPYTEIFRVLSRKKMVKLNNVTYGAPGNRVYKYGYQAGLSEFSDFIVFEYGVNNRNGS